MRHLFSRDGKRTRCPPVRNERQRLIDRVEQRLLYGSIAAGDKKTGIPLRDAPSIHGANSWSGGELYPQLLHGIFLDLTNTFGRHPVALCELVQGELLLAEPPGL